MPIIVSAVDLPTIRPQKYSLECINKMRRHCELSAKMASVGLTDDEREELASLATWLDEFMPAPGETKDEMVFYSALKKSLDEFIKAHRPPEVGPGPQQ